jgi:hypothetical protein
MIIGPILVDTKKKSSPTTVTTEIIGYFTNPQERAELLAKIYAAYAEPEHHLRSGRPDLETQKEK